MHDVPIVLHVGGPKVGFSALQHDLTPSPRRPMLSGTGVECEYVAIDANGMVLRGDDLDDFAALCATHAGIEDFVRTRREIERMTAIVEERDTRESAAWLLRRRWLRSD